jgi:hypothetical protein
MNRSSHIWGFALLALAFSQSGGVAHAATASGSFAVSVRVANVCETNGQCGTATIRSLGSATIAAALVTPLAATADRAAGERIDTRQNVGPVEIDF